MRISPLKLFFTSQGLGFVYFWISLAIPYLMYRGLTPLEAFSLMSLYQFMGVFLEYPTGVIGDRFGYRRTLFIANTLNALSMVILAQSGPRWIYLLGLTVLAVGSGFSSGNNQGLLERVSSNPRKDTANLTALAEFVIFLSSIIGAWIGVISYELALYISAFFMFSANIPLLLLPSDGSHKADDPSLVTIIKDGLKGIKNPLLAQLFLILAIYGGFFFSTKSIIGSFSDLYGFSLNLIGLFIGLSALSRAIGSKFYAHNQTIPKLYVLIFLAIAVLLLSISPVYVTVSIILVFHFAVGYLISAVDGDIHEMASDHTRSSLFSLKRLIMRLMSSGYLLIYGLFIERNQFGLLMLCLGVLMMTTALVTRQYGNAKITDLSVSK
ncbi:MFS transporter [Candidatus Woesebacteria bacterium]|nr:MFS transporter [Candidatus Woesebacteria bacterium]